MREKEVILEQQAKQKLEEKEKKSTLAHLPFEDQCRTIFDNKDVDNSNNLNKFEFKEVICSFF